VGNRLAGWFIGIDGSGKCRDNVGVNVTNLLGTCMDAGNNN
jgi:hypothetical protein